MNEQLRNFLTKRKATNEDHQTFTSMAGGKWVIDLSDINTRNEFISAFEKSIYWKRAFNPESSVTYNVYAKEAFLTECAPENQSRFYLDLDKFQRLSDPQKTIEFTELIDRCYQWSRRLINNANVQVRMFVFVSKKGEHTHLHFYWPDLIIDTKDQRKMLGMNLESFLDCQVDCSVYYSGLRLPGCLKTDSVCYYSWYPYCSGQQPPTVEDILLTPHPTQQRLPIDAFVLFDILKSSQSQSIETTTKTKPTSDKNLNTPKNITVDWDYQFPSFLEKVLAEKSSFKPPYKIHGKAKRKYTWFVDYNHNATEKCCHGKHHDRWKFFVNWNPKDNIVNVACLQRDCYKLGWFCLSDFSTEINDEKFVGDENDEVEMLPSPEELCNEIEPICHIGEEKLKPFRDVIQGALNKGINYVLHLMNYYLAKITVPMGFVHRLNGGYWSYQKREPLSQYFVDLSVVLDVETYKSLTIAHNFVKRSTTEMEIDPIESIDDSTPSPTPPIDKTTKKPGRPKSKTIQRTIFEIWEQWRHKRHFNKMICDPSLPPEGGPNDKPSPDLNIWKGYQIKPTSLPKHELDIAVKPLIDHIFEVICRSHPDGFCWLMKYLAHIIQRPHKKTGVAVILKSLHGSGKGIFINFLKDIFGGAADQHYGSVQNMDGFFNSFNEQYVGKIVLLFDETIRSNSKTHTQNLKRLITEDIFEARQKYVPNYNVTNLFNCFIFSNHFQNMGLEAGCRRLASYECLNDRRLPMGYKAGQIVDNSYFDAIANVDKGAVFQRFLEEPLDGFNPIKIVNTQFRIEMLLSCLTPIQLWVLELIDDTSKQDCFSNQVETDLMWNYFKEHFDTFSIKRITKVEFVHELKQFGCSEIHRRLSDSEKLQFQNRDRVKFICVPSRQSMKANFIKYLNIEDDTLVFNDY